jgi:ABC-type multidrug transport system ATPase subunit
MLATACALMPRPRLLMLDEPSWGLAPILVRRLFETIVEVNRRGVTILLVEQNVYRALSMAHRAYVLERGSVVMQGGGKGPPRDSEAEGGVPGPVSVIVLRLALAASLYAVPGIACAPHQAPSGRST